MEKNRVIVCFRKVFVRINMFDSKFDFIESIETVLKLIKAILFDECRLSGQNYQSQ
jgi:hypothetical protein